MLIDFGGAPSEPGPPDFLPFLPKNPQAPFGCDVFQYYRPCSKCEQGREYYGYATAPNGTWIVFLGEISGFGCVGPSQLVARIAGQLSCLIRVGSSLSDMLIQVNEDLTCLNYGKFTTLQICAIDLEQGAVDSVNAGAPNPLVIHADGSLTTINRESVGLPLGLGDGKDCQVQHCTQSFRMGDCLLMFTDGLVDAIDREGNKFGIKRVKRQMIRWTDKPTFIGEAIVKDYEEFTQGKLLDDMTLISVVRSA